VAWPFRPAGSPVAPAAVPRLRPARPRNRIAAPFLFGVWFGLADMHGMRVMTSKDMFLA